MNDMIYLFVAFIIIWGGVLAYVIRLGSMKRSLEARLERLEKRTFQAETEIA